MELATYIFIVGMGSVAVFAFLCILFPITKKSTEIARLDSRIDSLYKTIVDLLNKK